MRPNISYALYTIVLLAVSPISGCMSSAATEGKATDAATVVFINARLIDGISEEPLPNRAVLVRDSRIVAIVHTDDVELSPSATVIDLEGATLLPGLINSHVHLTPNPNRDAALETMLRQGVTTVRDLGGNGKLLATLATPSLKRPTVVYSGTFFGQGFMRDPRVARASVPFASGEAPWMKLITAQTDIAEAVASAREAGVTGIKLYASLDADTQRRITEEANAKGLLVWAHAVVFPAGPEHAVAAGVDELVHSKGLAALGATDVPSTFAEGIPKWMARRPFAQLNPHSASFQNMFTTMRDKGIALNPALIADGDVTMPLKSLPPGATVMRDWACLATAAAAEAGVMINAGTDFFGKPGLLTMEIERLTECGLTPMQAIKAATSNGAHAAGMAASHGTVEPGKVADLLVVSGDPASTITDLRKPVLVMKGGRIVMNSVSTGSTPSPISRR